MPHTPGPWNTIWESGTHIIDANAGKTDIAHVINRGNPDTTEANARLIAAAPELLEALQMVNAFYSEGVDEEDPTERSVMAAVRAAIGKAAPTGASPNP